MTFAFDPVAHQYTLDGQPLPSVTQVTQILGGYEHVPAEILARKAALGTHVHQVCELHDNGGVEESSIFPEALPYFEAYKKFLAENPCRVLMNEQQLYSPQYRFAGTLDRVFEFSNPRNGCWSAGVPVLIDIKTVASLMPTTAIQTAGYRLLLPDLVVPRTQVARAALQLKKDGSYRVQPYTAASDQAVFLSALTITHWRIANE